MATHNAPEARYGDVFDSGPAGPKRVKNNPYAQKDLKDLKTSEEEEEDEKEGK